MTAAVLDRVQRGEIVAQDPDQSPPREAVRQTGARGIGPAFTDLARRAAGAVSPRSNVVRLIRADNTSAGTTTWSAEVSEHAHAVRLAHCGRYLTIALDFDAKADGCDRVEFEAEMAKSIFEQVGLNPVMCSSGPTGGRHVFLTIGEPGISASAAARLARGLRRLGWRTLDISAMTNPGEGAIRPPLAPHRSGGRSLPIGLTWEHAVERLEDRNDPDLVVAVIDAVHRLANPRRQLKRTKEPASTAQFANGYPSGSEAAAAVAASVANRGGDLAEYMRVLSGVERASQLGEHLAERGPDPAYYQRTFDNAVTFVRTHPARGGSRPDYEVLEAWGKALAYPASLRGATLSSARAVLRVAQDHRRTLIGLSTRDLALSAGLAPATAARSFKVMTAQGMLEVLDDSTWVARRYRLLHPHKWEVPAAETVSPSPTGGVGLQTVSIASTPYAELADDAESLIWSPLGLGSAANRVYKALASEFDEEPVGRGAVITAAGVSGSQVDTLLNRLREHGLAEKVSRGHWTPLAPDSRTVATSLGIRQQNLERAEKYNRDGIRDKVRKIKLKVDHALETAGSSNEARR